jgi:hypothetical protein
MHWFRARTPSVALIALCGFVLVSACGDDRNAVPVACTQGDDELLAALRAAPGEVRVGDGKLSDCLTEDADGGQLQLVGTSFVETASRLAPGARREPEGRDALELGYLVAAAHRGGDHTQGVHDELLRRLDQELSAVDTSARAYRRGERAGRSGG